MNGKQKQNIDTARATLWNVASFLHEAGIPKSEMQYIITQAIRGERP